MIFSFRNKILIFVSAVLVFLFVVSFILINYRFTGEAQKNIQKNLQNAQYAFERTQDKDFIAHINSTRATSDNPKFLATLDPQYSGDQRKGGGFRGIVDPNTAYQGLKEANNIIGANLLWLVSPNGGVKIKADDEKYSTDPARKEENISNYPIVKEILQQAVDTGDIWNQQGLLYQVAGSPVAVGGEVQAILLAGYMINDTLAQDINKQAGADIAFYADELVASSLKDQKLRDEFVNQLRSHQDMIKQMKFTRKASSPTIFNLGGERYLTILAPLQSPITNEVVGTYAIFQSYDQAVHPLRQTQLLLVGIGGVALVIGIFVSFIIASGVTAPVKKLVEATKAVEEENYHYKVDISTKDELGILGNSFNSMIAELEKKVRVQEILGLYVDKAIANSLLENLNNIKLGGERRDVTVMFTDIRGFTAMSEKMDAVVLVNTLNEYFTIILDLLQKYGGTSNKFIGDSVMAFFGAPMPDPNYTQNAITAAMEIQRELKKYNETRVAKGQPPLPTGIGISTGSVIVGNIGSIRRLEYTVIGDEVNLASRLCGEAGKNQILISDEVYKRVRHNFKTRPLEPIKVKGISEPVHIFEVLYEEAPIEAEEITIPEAEPAEKKDGLQELYEKYIQARIQCKQSVEGMSYEKFMQAIQQQTEQVKSKFQAKEVEFLVDSSSGQAKIKAIPKLG